MARTLKVAVQMDPIEIDQHRRQLHLRPDAGGAAPRPRPVALRGAPHGAARRRQAPGRAPRGSPAGPRPPRHGRAQARRPLRVRRNLPARPRHHGRGADAPGSAVRHGLHHRHPPARAHPSEDAGGERPRRGAQRAGEAAGHALPRPDAAHHDHLGPRGDPRLPRSSTSDIIVKPLFGNGGAGVFRIKPDDENLAALLEMHFAALARAADVPALRARGAAGRQAHHPGRRRAGRRGQPRAGGRRGALQHACRRPAGEVHADRPRPRDLRRDRPDAARSRA